MKKEVINRIYKKLMTLKELNISKIEYLNGYMDAKLEKEKMN